MSDISQGATRENGARENGVRANATRTSEMLTIRIDGKECACQKGEYIYDVARRNNIPIPVLCRSDAFDDHRACCRICIVEVEIRGRRKVVTSCVYPVEQVTSSQPYRSGS